MQCHKTPVLRLLMIVFFVSIWIGCSQIPGFRKGNIGQMARYSVPDNEADWIRQGEPIEFEGEKWYPRDRFDILLDSEVLYMGEYRGVDIFIDKIDVRPFNKLYTKFGRNKFRIYTKDNDQG